MNPLIAEYVDIAERWCERMEASDVEGASALVDRSEACLAAIRGAGEEKAVLDLVHHHSDAVRLFAAAVLKERSPAEALAVYDELATSPIPFVAMSGKFIAEDMRAAETRPDR